MIVCDTSGLIAYCDRGDALNEKAARVIESDPGPFVVSPFVIAELDYLLATRRGVGAELSVLTELSSGAWELPAFGPADLVVASDLIDRYRDQDIGLADASLVVLADRYRTDRLLTMDHRHFSVVRTRSGKAFKLLPA